MRFNVLIPAIVAIVMAVSMPVAAETKAAKPAKTYDEQSFIKLMGNKSRKQVTDILGAPVKKEVAVKPTNVESVIGRPLAPATKGGDKVEMWYYSNIVRYDQKNTYKTTELTFVNGVCSSVAFFNNR
jgi:hypothetical protein